MVSFPVSTRKKLPPEQQNKKGCFVRTASVEICSCEEIDDIARKCFAKFETIQSSARVLDTMIERGKIVNSHYYINKWMLDTVERNDGKVLKLHRGGHYVTPSEFLNIDTPLEIKVIMETDGVVCLANPLWLSFK